MGRNIKSVMGRRDKKGPTQWGGRPWPREVGDQRTPYMRRSPKTAIAPMVRSGRKPRMICFLLDLAMGSKSMHRIIPTLLPQLTFEVEHPRIRVWQTHIGILMKTSAGESQDFFWPVRADGRYQRRWAEVHLISAPRSKETQSKAYTIPARRRGSQYKDASNQRSSLWA